MASAKNPLEILQIRVADLSGELEKIRVRAKAKLGGTHKKSPPSGSSSNVKTIEIRLTLPSWPRKFPSRADLIEKLRKLSKRDRAIVATALVIVIIGAFAFLSSRSNVPTANASGRSSRPQLVRGNPPFSTILPAGKNIDKLGGWARVSPPGRAPVYAYIDYVGKVQINVSEQPLPASFQSDPASNVAQLAQNFNAGDKFQAAGTTIYVATADDGAQSVITNLNKLLILISSSNELTNNQWAAYITSLR